jgi:hypothetical protein
MLEWLKGKQVDHPLADPKKARESVGGLPVDALKALEEISEWLDSIIRAESFGIGRRFELIDMLDGAARKHQRKLSLDYLATQRQQDILENRLWTAVFNFWKRLGAGYLQCIAQYEAGAAGTAAMRPILPVIVARAMRAITLQIKWVLLRYGQVEPRVWRELSRLYVVAEKGGFDGDQVAIYPGAQGTGAVKHEFLKALMLSASSTDSLTPPRQEIAERLIAHFGPRFRLGASPAAGANYYFDLAAAMPPARLLRRDAVKPTMRFFGPGEAFPELKRVFGQFVETGALPADVYLGQYDRNVMIGVMKHLALYWSQQPPARVWERRRMVTQLAVVPGLDKILHTLNPAAVDELDFSAERSVESWIAENVSEGGCGAIVPAQRSNWLRIGCLIGVRGETERHWGVGVIRRVTRDRHQQRRVGVQMLSRTAIPVKLASGGGGQAGRPAILLSTSLDRSGEVEVVMRTGMYNSRDSLQMTAGAKSYLLIPSKLAEGGEEYDRAKFKVRQRSAG